MRKSRLKRNIKALFNRREKIHYAQVKRKGKRKKIPYASNLKI